MNAYRELLIGCGHARDKRMNPTAGDGIDGAKWMNLFTLDNYNGCGPSILGNMDCTGLWPIRDWSGAAAELIDESRSDYPCLCDDSFNEVHAYEVLEHLGTQGDARAFFSHFSEIWRILKSDGYLCATVPSRYSPWLWGDPSHRRLINEESLSFLDQDNYKQLDGPKPSPMSDFRNIYRADFRIIERQDNHKQFFFILQAVKPSRVRERIP